MADYGNMDLEQGMIATPLDRSNFLSSFKGDGWGVGYNLGLLWQPMEQVSIGATFRSYDDDYFRGPNRC